MEINKDDIDMTDLLFDCLSKQTMPFEYCRVYNPIFRINGEDLYMRNFHFKTTWIYDDVLLNDVLSTIRKKELIFYEDLPG